MLLVTFFPILKSIFDEQNIGEDDSGYKYANPIFFLKFGKCKRFLYSILEVLLILTAAR